MLSCLESIENRELTANSSWASVAKRLNLFHEKALRMIYNDQISSFQELLNKDNSFTVHNFNIQSLAIEMLKVINNIAAAIIDVYVPHVIVPIFAQNLSLLFQVYVQFIMVKNLYSITIPLSGI